MIKLQKKLNFELLQIGNMGETPVCFNHLTNYATDSKRSKRVFIKATGHECCFTVVLGYLVDQTYLPLTIIFKHKLQPKEAKFPSGILEHVYN